MVIAAGIALERIPLDAHTRGGPPTVSLTSAPTGWEAPPTNALVALTIDTVGQATKSGTAIAPETLRSAILAVLTTSINRIDTVDIEVHAMTMS